MKFDSPKEAETPEKPVADFELPIEGFTGTPEEIERYRRLFGTKGLSNIPVIA